MPASTTAPPRTLEATGLLHLGALGIFLFLLGGGWDVSWHIVIGRDTFWSPPHLLLYGGILFTFTVLAGALGHALWLRRAGLSYAGPTVGLPGGLAVNPGILVVGLGALMALTSAPVDNLWHDVFGLDVVVWSPPHIQLVLGVTFSALGLLATLAAEMNAADPGRLVGEPASPPGRADLLLVVLATVMMSSLLALYSEYAFDIPAFPVWQGAAVGTAVAVGCLVAGACASGRRWAATAMALVAVGIHLTSSIVILAAPVIGRALAGLLPADYWPTPALPIWQPLFTLPAALAVDLWRRGERRPGAGVWGLAVVSAVFVAGNVVWYEAWNRFEGLRAISSLSWLAELPAWSYLVVLAAGIAGALAGGWVGAQLRPARAPARAGLRRELAAAGIGLLVVLALPGLARAHEGGTVHEEPLPKVSIDLGTNWLVAGVPVEIEASVDPPDAVGTTYDELLVHVDRGGVEENVPLAHVPGEPGRFRGTVTFPSAQRWSMAFLLTGGEELTYDWRLLDVGPPPDGHAVRRRFDLDIRTQDIRAPEDTWSGAMLLGKVSVTLYTAALSAAALWTLRRVAAAAPVL